MTTTTAPTTDKALFDEFGAIVDLMRSEAFAEFVSTREGFDVSEQIIDRLENIIGIGRGRVSLAQQAMAIGGTTPNLTAEVPERLELPDWLDADGLARPEMLEPLRAEFAAVEAELIDTARHVAAVLDRASIAGDATVAAINAAGAPGRPVLPVEIHEAVESAIGFERVDNLCKWMAGVRVGFDICDADERQDLFDRLGELAGLSSDWRERVDAFVADASA